MTLPPREVTTEQSCPIRKEQQRPRAFTRHPARRTSTHTRCVQAIARVVGRRGWVTGRTVREMRRRLVSYFDRRNRPSADDLASETLSRIGRTLENDGAIAATPPAQHAVMWSRSLS